jgi:hypothetical protein
MASWSDQVMAFGWAHLNGSNSFTGNVGRTLGLLTGGGFASPLWRLCHHPCLPLTKEGKSGGCKSRYTKVGFSKSYKFSNQVLSEGGVQVGGLGSPDY